MHPFPKLVEDKIALVANERQMGASVIAKMAADCYIAFAEEVEDVMPEVFWEGLYELAKKIIWSQPDMAPLFSLANFVLVPTKELADAEASTEKLRALVKELAQNFLSLGDEAQENINTIGLPLIEEGDTILTHSHSSCVKFLLEKAHKRGKSFNVIATESRPGLEGKLLAQELGRMGIETTLIVEAAALDMLQRCQKVFVGADRVSEKNFVNKVGTRALALGAKERNLDFIVACDSTKFVPSRYCSFARRQYPAEEVLEKPYPNVIVENPYFEVVPLSLVTAVLCEKGLLPSAGVAEYLLETVHFPDLVVP